MTPPAWLRYAVTKEIRGLALPWLATLLTMIASVAFDGRLRSVGLFVYFLGAATLGALSIGQEYSHRTLAILLSQPVRRERLFVTKLAVLASMLATLSFVAGIVLFGPAGFTRASDVERLAALVLPVACGVFVAPWLTMLCRNPIAGAVFSLPIPGLLLVVGELLEVATFGTSLGEGNEFRLVFMWWGTLGQCAIAAVMGWRLFMRLEAVDGLGQAVSLPAWLRLGPATTATAPLVTRGNPVWLLVKKELRLQPMPLAIAGLYVLGWLAAISLGRVNADLLGVFYVLTFFYAGLVALLIGALASAEERHLGTLDWQMLLPVSAWLQWAVKVGTAVGLVLVLSLGLPALLTSIHPSPEVRISPADFLRPLVVAWVLLLAVGGLYVSSFSTSGLRALLVAIPAVFGAGLFVRGLIDLGPAVASLPTHGFFSPETTVPFGPALVVSTAFVGLALRFALVNHRSADRAAPRVVRQVLALAVYAALGVTAMAALGV